MTTDKVEQLQIPQQSAEAMGLHYVTDEAAGIRRVRRGNRVGYVSPNGATIRDPETLRRIKSLAVPPAWTDVWICPDARGHLQATGRDARGRKQFRYHRRWCEIRDETKYARMISFAKTLPRIRSRVRRDLRSRGLSRNKVLAAVVRLLEISLIRVGNEEYARENDSFGLTTMRDRHVKVNGATLRFHFRGKSGKWHDVDIRDPRLAKVVKNCQDLRGQELFQYVDGDGARHDVSSSDVNDYLREISGHDFTAKDFRTWAGTVLAAMALQEFREFQSKAQAKKNVVAAIERVAERLGNTPAVCRKCYVHPDVLDSYLDGSLAGVLKVRAEKELTRSLRGLHAEEAAVLTLLRHRLSLEEKLKRSLNAERRKRRRKR